MSLIETTTTALLTLAIYSFLAGDNPFYKFAEHLLVGLTIGYTLVITLKSVIWPQAILPVTHGEIPSVVPLVLGCLILLLCVLAVGAYFFDSLNLYCQVPGISGFFNCP